MGLFIIIVSVVVSVVVVVAAVVIMIIWDKMPNITLNVYIYIWLGVYTASTQLKQVYWETFRICQFIFLTYNNVIT